MIIYLKDIKVHLEYVFEVNDYPNRWIGYPYLFVWGEFNRFTDYRSVNVNKASHYLEHMFKRKYTAYSNVAVIFEDNKDEI